MIIQGLVQDYGASIANALALPPFCTKPLISFCTYKGFWLAFSNEWVGGAVRFLVVGTFG